MRSLAADVNKKDMKYRMYRELADNRSIDSNIEIDWHRYPLVGLVMCFRRLPAFANSPSSTAITAEKFDGL